jgi:hypothetical protein
MNVRTGYLARELTADTERCTGDQSPGTKPLLINLPLHEFMPLANETLCMLRSWLLCLIPSANLGHELLQVVIDVDLKKLAPFGQRHFSEHRVRPPVDIASQSSLNGEICSSTIS